MSMLLTYLIFSIMAAEIVLYLVLSFAGRGVRSATPSGWFYFILCACLFTMAAVSLLSYADTLRKLKGFDAIGRRYFAVEALMRDLCDMETGQRGYLLTRRDYYLKPYEVAKQGVDRHCDDLRAVYAKSPGLDRVEGLCGLAVLKVRELQKTVELEMADRHAEAIEVVKNDSGKNLMDLARAAADDLVRSNGEAYGRARADMWAAANARFSMAIMVLVGSVIQMLMGAIMGWPRPAPPPLNAPLAG